MVTKVKELLIELGWETDRMSSCGKESLNELFKIFEIPTDKDLEFMEDFDIEEVE